MTGYKTLILASSILLGCCSTLSAGEPTPTDDTLFLSNFNSLEKADFAAGSAVLEAHGATLVEGKSGKGLSVGQGGYLTFASEKNLLARQGTLIFWFKPNWSGADTKQSHSLITWSWDDGKHGYCVLSHGWWEPAGAGKTYFVFQNQLYCHASTPLTYRKNRWMHFTLTWAYHENNVAARTYVDGHLVTSAIRRHTGAVADPKGPICLGADRGTHMPRQRWADGVFDGLEILNRTLDKQEVRDAFRAREPNWRQVEREREAWLYGVLEQPYKPNRDGQGRILESRALLDEGTGWTTPQGAKDTIDRLTRAGFNVYVPCIWHGRGARWPSKLTPMEKGVEQTVAEHEGFDPLANLIRVAHAKGVEVHPWFCVCYGDSRWKPLAPFIEEGTPRGACEAHNPKFRQFIVELMIEAVNRYEIDGVNLDYIRAKGISTSATARASYRKQFGADLLADLERRQPNGWVNAKIVKWQDGVIAKIVRAISEQARAARPNIVISIDGHPRLPTDEPGVQGRNGFWWAEEGWIDVLYSMDYSRQLAWQKTDVIRRSLKRPSASVIIVGNYERTDKGGVISREGQLVADLIGFCQRKYPGNGVGLYWLGSLDEAQTKALRAGPFREPALPHWIRASAER